VLESFPDLGRVHAERLTLPAPDDEFFARLYGLGHVALLDSAAGGRFTVVGCSPLARMTWTPRGGVVQMPGGPQEPEDDLKALLRAGFEATALHGAGPLPFGPGWIGQLGYGLRVAFEDVPDRHPDESDIADLDLAYYPAVAVYDAGDQTWWLTWRDGTDDVARTLHARLNHAFPTPPGGVTAPAVARIEPEVYLESVRRAVEYIHAGDVFQVNYAHEFRAPYQGDPLALYLRLRRLNPAAFGAFLDLGGDRAVLSTSPELFLSLREGTVVTRPIKGTRPRGADPKEDEALKEELLASEKDAAELAMIIDLERNDLGRTCLTGSVAVTEERRVETYASVHHLVATVTAELDPNCDRVDLIEATFPGGSITGAPKIRAMEIIDELEANRRGPYTGSIGIFGDDGSLELNIAIRTVVLARGEARVHVGGGIVADSDPEAEYQETLAKGDTIFRALTP
jgi:para-aminobenzoate synthetase component 1